MARIGSSVGNARAQRINQARFGDITVRYGKDKRSNVNRKLPSSFKTGNYENKISKKKGFYGSSGSLSSINRNRQRISREYIDYNRITLSKFIRWTVFLSVSLFCIWAYIYDDVSGAVIQRQRRSVAEVLSGITNKYVATGYTNGQSAAAWTRQRRSRGAQGDDMSNPHNGATSDGESIVQKMLSDFAKLVKTESEGYTSNNKNDNNDNNENIKYTDQTNNNDL